MLFQTHLLLGIIFFLSFKDYFSGGNVIIFFLLILLGSLLPDLDENQSKINRWSGIFGSLIAFFSQHRGFFHSLIFNFILFLAVFYLFNFYYAFGLFLGYFSHLLGDALTPMGIKLFYPFSDFKIKGPVKTGGFLEGILIVILVVLIIKEFF